ncbi:MAG: hypothetical protein IKO34_01605 [Bacteroidales bacterium]|nr:hypothetical protein [Bacteroidales bacterium]
MLKEGLDVYIPMVDDDAIDAVVKRPNGKYVEIQIKARSKDVGFGDAALFAAIPHEHRENYWFVFYSERLDSMWIMSSAEFLRESNQNKRGKNVGKHSICFNGRKKDKEYCKERFNTYKCSSFTRILNEDPK